MNTGDSLWHLPGLRKPQDFSAGAEGEKAYRSAISLPPPFLPRYLRKTGPRRGRHLPKDPPSELWCSFVLPQESVIPKLSVTQNGKVSCRLKQKLITHYRAEAPIPGRKAGAVSTKEDCVLAFPTLHTPSCWGPTPLQPVFQVSRAHLPGSVHSARSLLLSPLLLGPGLFGDNGGKVKHGLKTGSESLNSQAGSLEGAEQQEGPGQMGKVSRVFPSYPTKRESTNCLPGTREPLHASGNIKFLSHQATSGGLPGVVCSLHQAEGRGHGGGGVPLLQTLTQLRPLTPHDV